MIYTYETLSCEAMVEVLTTQINAITDEIKQKIKAESTLNEKKKILETIPGIGELIASQRINHILGIPHFSGQNSK